MPCLRCGLSHKANMTCNQAKHLAQQASPVAVEEEPVTKEDVPVTEIVTKSPEDVTKTDIVTKRGRPCLGEKAMTSSERQKKSRAKKHVKNA